MSDPLRHTFVESLAAYAPAPMVPLSVSAMALFIGIRSQDCTEFHRLQPPGL